MKAKQKNSQDRRTLLIAWAVALVLSGCYALALYLNPDWRTTYFGMLVEETDEEGIVKKKVRVERPEPNEDQVREIARNQERKKREELKREVKKLVEIVRETEEVKRQRKNELAAKTVDDEAFKLAIEIEILAAELRRSVEKDAIMSNYEVPQQGSSRVLEIATELADKARADTDGVLSAEEAEAQVNITEELVRTSDKLVNAFERGRDNLVDKESNNHRKNRIKRELRDEIRLSKDLLEKSEAYLAFIRALLEARLAATDEPPPVSPEELAEIGREMLNNLSEEQREALENSLGEELEEDDGEAADFDEMSDSELAEIASEQLSAEEMAALAGDALSEMDELSFDPGSLSDSQTSTLGEQALDAFGDQAAMEEMLAQFAEEALNGMSAHDLYEAAQQLGEQVNENFTQARAAELAAAQSQSFQEALEDLYQPAMPETPDLSGVLGPEAPPPTTSQEFAAFNEALEQAGRAASDLARTAESRASQLSGINQSQSGEMSGEQLSQMLRARSSLQSQMASMASNQGQPRHSMTDMSQMMAQAYQLTDQQGTNAFGEGNYNSILNRMTYEGSMGRNTNTQGRILEDISTGQIVAQALPGRKFTDASSREGWLFIDTWYVIGPWERPRNAATSFDDKKFPPETLIDLDATYPGKKHPRTKTPMELEWRFVQSNNIRINPPDEINNSTYYAYTEVHSDRPREVLLAVGTDDYGKVWINDLVVWEENGLSSWQLDQGFRKVLLKKGYNKILLRLESGPGVAYFSLMLCPVDLDS